MHDPRALRRHGPVVVPGSRVRLHGVPELLDEPSSDRGHDVIPLAGRLHIPLSELRRHPVPNLGLGSGSRTRLGQVVLRVRLVGQFVLS